MQDSRDILPTPQPPTGINRINRINRIYRIISFPTTALRLHGTLYYAAAGIETVRTLSDHRDASFGTAYGVLVRELRLLARAVFVVDREGIVQYTEIVKEIAEEPDYQAVLDAVSKLTQK